MDPTRYMDARVVNKILGRGGEKGEPWTTAPGAENGSRSNKLPKTGNKASATNRVATALWF